MAKADVAFTGSVPGLYDDNMVPVLFTPYAEDMAGRLAGLGSGELLETAAGTGVLTRSLIARLPAAVKVTATDLNQPMLDLGRQRLISDRVTWKQADAGALPFAEGRFDAVVCQFGAMFFPDRRKAYGEALRVLKPGKRFHLSVWDRLAENELSAVAMEALAATFPVDPPSFIARLPHGYHDIGAIRADLTAAGFGDIDIETVALQSRAASARQPALGICQGSPMRGEIEARAPGRLDEVTDRVAAALRERFGDGPIAGKMQAHVVVARRPD